MVADSLMKRALSVSQDYWDFYLPVSSFALHVLNLWGQMLSVYVMFWMLFFLLVCWMFVISGTLFPFDGFLDEVFLSKGFNEAMVFSNGFCVAKIDVYFYFFFNIFGLQKYSSHYKSS